MGVIDCFSDEIMHPFTLYHENNVIKITSNKSIGPILRLCTTKNKIFLLSKDHELYSGTFHVDCINTIEIKSIKNNIIDIDIIENYLYIVCDNGKVQKTNIQQDEFYNNWIEIHFRSDTNDENNKILIKRIKCNQIGCIYITNEKELYGSGNCGNILNSKEPIKLESFNDKKILDISAGDDFFIVLASDTIYETDNDDNSSNSSNSSMEELNLRLKRCETNDYYIGDNSDDEKSNSKDSLISKTTQNSYDLMENNLKQIIYDGSNLLSTLVLSFGIRNNGVLGTGDHIKRSGINEIHNLTKIGICSISSGHDHSLAKTIDGRVYQWGLNQYQHMDFSSPKEISLNENNKTLDSSILIGCCDSNQTILLSSDLDLLRFGKIEYKNDFKMFSTLEKNFPIILSSNNFILQNHCLIKTDYQQNLISLQNTCRELIKNRHYIKFIIFLRKTTLKPLSFINEIHQLCRIYLKILCIMINCLKTINQYYISDINYDDIIFIKYSKEFIHIFNLYTKIVCDINSINGFSDIVKIVNTIDIGTNLELYKIFELPFQQISNIIKFIEKLLKTTPENNFLNDKLIEWQEFLIKNRIEIELSDHTKDFWLKHDKYLQIKPFKQTQRRIILDSDKVPLKLFNSSKFTTNSFILFSDYFCHWGSLLIIYPLQTFWLQIENEITLKIITPEKIFMLQTKNHEDKLLWFDQIEISIINALGKRKDYEKSPKVRTVSYTYSSDHSKYPGVRCYGRWLLGQMHGICHLEYPDGKVYYGDIKYGEIEGYGKMLIPSIGMYDGTFRAGKFNGYGIYEMKDNTIYEGYFRDGLFHGHGTLRDNNSIYVGGFVAGVKNGYGILDDNLTGDKYMGMFADNKRTGAGTCITMNGDYFEGLFINDILMGDGFAVFANGNYYDGVLSIDGPKGEGTYYLPQSEIKNSEDNIESKDSNDVYMTGNIISGNLTGSWNDVKIINGAVSLNQKFSKYPLGIGALLVDNNRKYRPLFDNWEETIFGNIAMSDTKLVWNRIAIYMTNTKEREKFKEQDFINAQAGHFSKNLLLQANHFDLQQMKNSSSLDKISLRSTSSLYSKRSTLELNVKRKSYSNETLFDKGRRRDHLSSNNSINNNIFNKFINFRLNHEKQNESGRCSREGSSSSNDTNVPNLEFIPNFGIESLKQNDVASIKDYLTQAFKDPNHPLSILNQKISNCFYTSYGCWKVKPTPILSSQAMEEWESISLRIFEIIQKIFPAISSNFCYVDDSNEIVSHINLLYPIVLSEGIYSTLFVLYANKMSQKDEMYRQKILICNKKSDEELIENLKIEKSSISIVTNESFKDAVSNFKEITEKYCPHGMLKIIEKSIELIECAHKNCFGETVIIGADKIMPLTIFLVLRADVPHLGAELALLEDLLGSSFEREMSGFIGYCYTTIKAAYEHIIGGRLFQS